MSEKWKKIRGLPKYEVSTLGNIRHKRTGNSLKFSVLYGRNTVLLRDSDNKLVRYYVDNIVAYTFLSMPYGITEPKLYHKNKDYLDDRLENLHFRKNVKTNGVLIRIYQFKNNKCYLISTMSFARAVSYLNCKSNILLHALAHTSIIKNDGKEYKVEYNFSKI